MPDVVPGQARTHSDDDATLLAWLAEHDELCPACRYNLRGLTVTRCPECDSRLALSVFSPDIRLGPWLVGVLSFALGLGFDGVACVLMGMGLMIALVRNGFSLGAGPPLSFYILPVSLVILGLACAAGIAILLRRRHRWLRLTLAAQWTAAITIFVVVGVAHLLVGIAFIILN